MKIQTTTLRNESLPLSQVSLFALAFLIPFLLSGPQLLVGGLVNAMLCVAAINLPRKQQFAFAMLPSLGVLAQGLLFGPFTPLILYFLPFIWLSNYLLMRIFASVELAAIPRVLLAASVKALALFAIASLYVNLSLVPAFFLTAMGWIQMQTALLGGFIAVASIRILKR